MDTTARANCNIAKQIFIVGAMVGCVNHTLPDTWRQAVIDEIERTDIRRRPSVWNCCDQLSRSSLEDRHLVTDAGLQNLHIICSQSQIPQKQHSLTEYARIPPSQTKPGRLWYHKPRPYQHTTAQPFDHSTIRQTVSQTCKYMATSSTGCFCVRCI